MSESEQPAIAVREKTDQFSLEEINGNGLAVHGGVGHRPRFF